MNTQWLSKTFNWLENELREIDVLKFRAKMKPVALEPKIEINIYKFQDLKP